MGINKICAWSAVILLLTSCATTERKAKNWAYNNKEKLAEWCADCFPVRKSEVIKGDTIIRVDTISEVVSDTIRVNADCPDGTTVTVDCPPNKVITRVVKSHTTDTIKVRDSAFEMVLSNERDLYKGKLEEMKKSSDNWRKTALWLIGILGVGLFVKFYFKV